MKNAKEQAMEQGKTSLSDNFIKDLEHEYDDIMNYVSMEFPPPATPETKKRG